MNEYKFEDLMQTMKCPKCGKRLKLYQSYWKKIENRIKWLNCKCGFQIFSKPKKGENE